MTPFKRNEGDGNAFLARLQASSALVIRAAEVAQPMPDKEHAADAKGRATQLVNKGNLSRSAEKRIDAKANRILRRGT